MVALVVENLTANAREDGIQKTWVRSLGQEDTLEQEMATQSSISARMIPWTEEPLVGYKLWGRKELDTTKAT